MPAVEHDLERFVADAFRRASHWYRRAVIQAGLKGLPCEAAECRFPLRVTTLPISKRVLEADAPVAAGLLIRQVSALQQLDEMRSGNPEEIGGVLRGQLLILGYQDNRPAQLHIPDHFLEQSENGIRELQSLAIGPTKAGVPSCSIRFSSCCLRPGRAAAPAGDAGDSGVPFIRRWWSAI